MMRMPPVRGTICVLLLGVQVSAQAGDANSGADVAPRLQAILAVGEKGQGNVAASKAWQELVKADPTALPEILAALDQASPLAANWIRGAIDSIAERALTSGGKL